MMIFPFYFLDYKYHDGDNRKDSANDKDYKKVNTQRWYFGRRNYENDGMIIMILII